MRSIVLERVPKLMATFFVLMGTICAPPKVWAQEVTSQLQECEQEVVAQGVSADTSDFFSAVGSNLDARSKSELAQASEATHKFDLLSIFGKLDVVACLVKARDFTDAKPIMDGLAMTPEAPAKIFWFQAVIDYQVGDTNDALVAAEHSYVLNPNDADLQHFLQSRFPADYARERHRLLSESHSDPEYVYWEGLSADERQIIEANNGTPYVNTAARPCHITYDHNKSVGEIEIWYYNCSTPGGIGSSSYTFVNGNLTDNASY